MLKKNIVLIGMMAAGKTTIGFKLAKKLKFHFIDIDSQIEKSENKKIIDIFKDKGEEYFRKIEEKTTLSYLNKTNSVISIGGGAFLNSKIRKKIKNNSRSVWLSWKFKTILTRLSRNKRRPVVLKLNKNDLANLYKKRVKFYKMSEFKINCEHKNKNEIINQITKIIKNEDS
jgi:shikimate kinase/shikimate kinase/3-dehydroquinate synthase|tara:strand:+ start:17 stop:532 length:516 start_codon:yes stop_codon:yes gene_type:complete